MTRSVHADTATHFIGTAASADSTPILALSVEEALKVMRISRQTFYDEVNAGRLRTFNVGRRRLVSVEAIREWIEDREAESASTAV